ncbi:uncharacterized protein STEHIDRAFT_120456, partial [Stereum hirsutum FP-91666 SS1]|uniref:uncharacterized protein n=1 Tax=Stereum hirsutum (strain FP-91666) TaxID=721885 RepID=UPI000440C77B
MSLLVSSSSLRLAARAIVPNARYLLNRFARPLSSLPHLASTSESHGSSIQRAHSAPFPNRTHTCGALTSKDVGSNVVLAGWLVSERKVSKAMSFFQLKDSFGQTQLTVYRGSNSDQPSPLAPLSDVPMESTVLIQGQVSLRPENQRRPLPAGDIEVKVKSFTLLNPADRNMPFLPSDTQNMANDDLRAQYRYLDLRRSELSGNLRKRSRVAHIVRSVLDDRDFVEIETPILLKSSPEGAREFLVPTRLSKSSPSASDDPNANANASPASVGTEQAQVPLFYALPQSPQQPKQLLMCSGGVDRYYQLARCFRDEDGRKDRQPEFTQIDLEMAFVSWGRRHHDGTESGAKPDTEDGWRIGGQEVREVVEDIIRAIWSKVEDVELPDRFRVMTYNEAMSRYGSDKPDLRFGLEITGTNKHDQPPASPKAEIVECFVVRKSADTPFIEAARECPLENAVERILITDQTPSSWLSESRTFMDMAGKNLQTDLQTPSVDPGDVVYLSKRRQRPEGGSTALGRQRLRVADLAQVTGTYVPPISPCFLWITEFPLFTHADEDKDFLAKGRWSSSHHPFTAPMWEDIDKLYAGRVDEVRGQHYDLVLNGVEIGGGSVRVHDSSMQEHIFSNVLKLDNTEKATFNHLLHALKCGAPPHGGIALGFDRLMAILCKTTSIRDVIAFPKTSAGTDLLFKSPAAVASEDVLRQYGIQPRVRQSQTRAFSFATFD